MITVKTIKQVRKFVKKEKQKGKRIGFVPTMGCLHEGHLSLVRAAKRECDIIAVSIFVNPTQFGPGEDFKRYPRALKRDKNMLKKEGADIVFIPSSKEMYPGGLEAFVEVPDLARGLCGKSRPGHFKGVATVVAKLFNIIEPDAGYFGQKDYQQAIVIRKMIRDLKWPVRIQVCPIVRERDGLAKSSRNIYLSAKERDAAKVLYQSLCFARAQILKGIIKSGDIKKSIRSMIGRTGIACIEYVEIVDAETLKPEAGIKAKKVLIALAVRFGKTKLIDNVIVNRK